MRLLVGGNVTPDTDREKSARPVRSSSGSVKAAGLLVTSPSGRPKERPERVRPSAHAGIRAARPLNWRNGGERQDAMLRQQVGAGLAAVGGGQAASDQNRHALCRQTAHRSTPSGERQLSSAIIASQAAARSAMVSSSVPSRSKVTGANREGDETAFNTGNN